MGKLNIKNYYPMNFIIRRPLPGFFFLFLFCLGFTFIYKPFDVKESAKFTFLLTMVLYNIGAVLPGYILLLVLRRFPYFRDAKEWNIVKDLIVSVLVLILMGITVYFAGFFIEEAPEYSRWNWPTFFDSFFSVVLVGAIPFTLAILFNYRYLSAVNTSDYDSQISVSKAYGQVKIESTLKKESLSFREDELLYVVSDGNYSVFCLYRDGKVRKEQIRNSISNIEKQLAAYPGYFRCHRAWIVNLEKVNRKRGNSLGYRLALDVSSAIIPVSRQKVKDFDLRYRGPDRQTFIS